MSKIPPALPIKNIEITCCRSCPFYNADNEYGYTCKLPNNEINLNDIHDNIQQEKEELPKLCLLNKYIFSIKTKNE